MSDNDLKVIVKAKELAVHTYRLTSNDKRYAKKYRHSLVDKIQIKALEIHDNLLEANRINNTVDNRKRIEKISKAVILCDELLFYIELSMHVTTLGQKSAEYWSKLVCDVKYMALAWRNKEKQ